MIRLKVKGKILSKRDKRHHPILWQHEWWLNNLAAIKKEYITDMIMSGDGHPIFDDMEHKSAGQHVYARMLVTISEMKEFAPVVPGPITIKGMKLPIEWDKVDEDGDVFVKGCFDKGKPKGVLQPDAITACIDTVLDATNQYRCQMCGGVFDRTAADPPLDKLKSFGAYYMNFIACDDCYKMMLKTMYPQPKWQPGGCVDPAYGEDQCITYGMGGYYNKAGEFVLTEISIVAPPHMRGPKQYFTPPKDKS